MQIFFAAEAAAESGSPLAALGVDLKSFIFQLITFALVFLVLKRFAFDPISKMLAKRRQTLEDGIRLGQKMEKERDSLEKKVTQALQEARAEGDKIIATAQKEAREIAREAEKAGQKKADAMVADAQARIDEESHQAKQKLEKDIVGLVSEATEAIVGEKVDPEKDAEIIDKTLKGRKK
jgi:F-type H+-transporting ATPase subunit b